jgi:hypothetical protein
MRILLGPVPTRYVFVPCSVNLLGFPPVIRTIDGLRRVIGGSSGREDAMMDALREITSGYDCILLDAWAILQRT